MWSLRHSFEVTDHYLTKRVRGLSHLYLVIIVNITVLPNIELTAQQNQIDWNHKVIQIPW
jgi:hypothetical protein